MKSYARWLGSFCVASWVCLQSVLAQTDNLPDGKLRILVDKVMEPAIEPEAAVAEAVAAGFNVFTLRQASNDEQRLRRLARAADAQGIKTVAWMWGTRRSPDEPSIVVASGFVGKITSPNADVLWHWMTEAILMHARVSLDHPALIGSFLDMETYGETREVGWAYALSYDDLILAAFAAHQEIEIPELENSRRRRWLVDAGVHDAFEAFQIDSWRQRCRRLRQAVDEINPNYGLWIYPGPYSPFIVRAAGPEWSKPEAPMVLAEMYTYGRPNWYARTGRPPTQAASLEANRRTLDRGLARLESATFPYRYVGGIDPFVRGADPEFSMHNAVMQSEHTDGYWVFYEGPKHDLPDHALYMEAFAEANRAIAAGDFGLWQQPRQAQDLHRGHVIEPRGDGIQVGVFGLSEVAEARLEAGGRFAVHRIHDTGAAYLSPLDVVIVQNYGYNTWDNRYLSEGLETFARAGKAVLLTHDTSIQCSRLLRDLATAERVDAQSGGDRYGRLVGATVKVDDPESVGLKQPLRFAPASPTVWTFRPGKAGRPFALDADGRPVAVLAEVDTGRAACYGGQILADASPEEWALFEALIDWLSSPSGQ